MCVFFLKTQKKRTKIFSLSQHRYYILLASDEFSGCNKSYNPFLNFVPWICIFSWCLLRFFLPPLNSSIKSLVCPLPFHFTLFFLDVSQVLPFSWPFSFWPVPPQSPSDKTYNHASGKDVLFVVVLLMLNHYRFLFFLVWIRRR